MKIKKCVLLGIISASLVAATACSSGEGAASNFPSKDITMIVPFGAGGANDVLARVLGEHLEAQNSDWNVVVENVEGGGGSIGQARGADAKPDGHTVTTVTNSIVSNPMFNNVSYTHESFTPVTVLSREPKILFASKTSGFTTVEEFIAAAESNPGKVTIGTSGAQTIDAFHARELQAQADIELLQVPHGGSAEAVVQAEGGHLDTVFADYAEVQNQLESGSLVPLMVLAEDGHADLPDVPTFVDAGMADANFPANWRGLALPKGADSEIVEIWETTVKGISETEEYQDAVAKLGLKPYFGDSEELAELIAQTAETYSSGQ